jgi:cytochrome c oxidase subunit 2
LGEVKAGTNYRVICAEYCGTAHTKMLATAKTIDSAGFDKFLVDAKKAGEEGPMAGKKIATQSCLACHATETNEKKAGPSWKGLYDAQRKLADGSTVKADDAYLKESILNPSAKVAEGFSPSMPSFQGKLNDQQLKSVIEYIKTLK